MINKISLENFRWFDKLTIKPGKINIFVGRNNTGKSSIFYSLLLISNKLNLINRLERSQLINNLIKFGENYSKIEVKINKDNISLELFSQDHEKFNKKAKDIVQEILMVKGVININSELMDKLLRITLLIKYKFNKKPEQQSCLTLMNMIEYYMSIQTKSLFIYQKLEKLKKYQS